MGLVLEMKPTKLSEAQLDALCQQVRDASEYMADEQILCVADALHDTLRQRRMMRGRVHKRMEEKLCANGGPAFPF